ncbi:MAG: hypothetical protein QCH35_05950 [Methanomicrobiaceae archaeon]|nr:hypothetical protein [Methanomicrobiaceae archaeon]
MEQTGCITLVLERDIFTAFCEAARRAGSSPDEIVASLIQDYLSREGDAALQARIEAGVRGIPRQEIFRLQIECEDELCRTPRIRMDGRSPAREHGAEKK